MTFLAGDAVINFANGLLDEIAPLVHGRWGDVVRLWPKFVGSVQRLELLLKDEFFESIKLSHI